MSDDTNVRDFPVADVDFDLDAVTKDASEIRPNFRTTVGGRVIEMTSPDDVEWQDLLLMQNPVELIDFVTSREDLAHIRAQSIPGWKLGKLMDAYSIHFGLDERMKRAQREQRLATLNNGR